MSVSRGDLSNLKRVRPIQWEQLADFEEELRVLKGAGITPIVIVDDYPRWATDNTVREDGQPTSCGRLLDDKVDDFAVFMTQARQSI